MNTVLLVALAVAALGAVVALARRAFGAAAGLTLLAVVLVRQLVGTAALVLLAVGVVLALGDRLRRPWTHHRAG